MKSILVLRIPTEGRQSVPFSDLCTPVYLMGVAEVVPRKMATGLTSNVASVRMFNGVEVNVLLAS